MRKINDTLPAFFPAHPVSYWERQKAADEVPFQKAMSLHNFERGDHTLNDVVELDTNTVSWAKAMSSTRPSSAQESVAADDWHHPFWMAKMAQDNGITVLASFDGGEFRTAGSRDDRWFFLKENCEQPGWRYRIEGADRDGWIPNDFSGKPPIPNRVIIEIKTGVGGVGRAIAAAPWWSRKPGNGSYIAAWRFAQ